MSDLISKNNEDIAKAFQLGVAFGFGKKYDEMDNVINEIKKIIIPQQNIGHCRDCKWWKESDGTFKRGIGAESKCPINREEVYEGTGYCFMFEPQKNEE